MNFEKLSNEVGEAFECSLRSFQMNFQKLYNELEKLLNPVLEALECSLKSFQINVEKFWDEL